MDSGDLLRVWKKLSRTDWGTEEATAPEVRVRKDQKGSELLSRWGDGITVVIQIRIRAMVVSGLWLDKGYEFGLGLGLTNRT